MELNFNLPARYYEQAEMILSFYLKDKYPRFVSIDEITEKFINDLEGYKINNLYVELLSDDIINNRPFYWKLPKELNDPGDNYSTETLRRLKWLYKGKKKIKFDKYFIARVMKITEDVYGDIVIRDFL